MQIFAETKDPAEVKDYVYDWSRSLGETESVASQTVAIVNAGGTTSPSSSLVGNVSRVFFAGGTHTERVVFTITIVTSEGRTLEEAFGFDVVDNVLGSVGDTDIGTLRARLVEATEARHKLAMGQAVIEVWRDGRRIRYQANSIGELDNYIRELRETIDGLLSVTAATLPRRRFIPVGFA